MFQLRNELRFGIPLPLFFGSFLRFFTLQASLLLIFFLLLPSFSGPLCSLFTPGFQRLALLGCSLLTLMLLLRCHVELILNLSALLLLSFSQSLHGLLLQVCTAVWNLRSRHFLL